MEEKILKTFLYNKKLKFNEIEKATNLRSNALAYHLKALEKKNVILKEGDSYALTQDFEYIIPYVSDRQAVLPAILISIGKNGEFFLPPRKKRPYQGFLGMPAGRLLIGEGIGEAVTRIMREKYGIAARLNHVKSISLEHVRKDRKIMNSFLQILVSATVKDKLTLINLEENKRRIIKSDYLFLKNHEKKRYHVETVNSKEN